MLSLWLRCDSIGIDMVSSGRQANTQMDGWSGDGSCVGVHYACSCVRVRACVRRRSRSEKSTSRGGRFMSAIVAQRSEGHHLLAPVAFSCANTVVFSFGSRLYWDAGGSVTASQASHVHFYGRITMMQFRCRIANLLHT